MFIQADCLLRVNSYEYRLADQSCCGVGFMAPDFLSAPDKVALPGLSQAFPFGEPLLLPIKIVSGIAVRNAPPSEIRVRASVACSERVAIKRGSI
jgi:hypothetical protein